MAAAAEQVTSMGAVFQQLAESGVTPDQFGSAQVGTLSDGHLVDGSAHQVVIGPDGITQTPVELATPAHTLRPRHASLRSA